MTEPSKENYEALAKELGYDLDYLTCGSPIFQVKNLYTFTSDSIALAHAVQEEEIERLVDLCSGSGVVGFEVAGNKNVNKLTLVEIQKELADASSLSAKLFSRSTEVEVLNINLIHLADIIEDENVNVVVCNPPYFKRGSGEVSKDSSRAIARHEIELTLEDIVSEARRILVFDGRLYMVHLFSRDAEIEKMLKKYGFAIQEKTVLDGKQKRVIYTCKKV